MSSRNTAISEKHGEKTVYKRKKNYRGTYTKTNKLSLADVIMSSSIFPTFSRLGRTDINIHSLLQYIFIYLENECTGLMSKPSIHEGQFVPDSDKKGYQL